MSPHPHSESRDMSPPKSPASAEYFDWPNSLRKAVQAIVRGVREVATGIDTWSAIRHGIIPLDDRSRSPRSSESPHDPRGGPR